MLGAAAPEGVAAAQLPGMALPLQHLLFSHCVPLPGFDTLLHLSLSTSAKMRCLLAAAPSGLPVPSSSPAHVAISAARQGLQPIWG